MRPSILNYNDSNQSLDYYKLPFLFTANWLNIHKSLREQGIDETGILILRKGLYVTDDNVDVNDPIQVNLIFVQVSLV